MGAGMMKIIVDIIGDLTFVTRTDIHELNFLVLLNELFTPMPLRYPEVYSSNVGYPIPTCILSIYTRPHPR